MLYMSALAVLGYLLLAVFLCSRILFLFYLEINVSFENLNLVKQHQAVMNALKEDMKSLVHALQLKTFTPQSWEKEKEHYNM